MAREQDAGRPTPTDLTIGRIDISVPGLRPDVINTNGHLTRPSNLLEVASEVKKAIIGQSWYAPLMKEVRQHKKTAIFVTALGGITIFVGTTAGYEFGIRHGRDLKVLQKILRRRG